VLAATLNQVRLAPMGRVVGLDLAAAHAVAAARGFDLAVVSELLQAAESGLREALNDNAEPDRHPSL
jgi:hypothetical protein